MFRVEFVWETSARFLRSKKGAKILGTSSARKSRNEANIAKYKNFDFRAACLPRSRLEKLRSRELSQPALSYEAIENFTKDLEVRRDLGTRASPVNQAHVKRSLATESVSCFLLIRIARMHMDWNLKKLGQIFQVLMLCLQKSPKNIYYATVSSPWWNCSIHSSHMLHEHFV